MTQGDSRSGEVLAAKYRLEERLGSGGMGDVYRATNELVGRTVAIKLLRPEHAENEQIVERFLREARAANLVRHPNVVDVLDVGRDDRGSPFLVQELLEGQDLAKYAASKGRLSLEEVVDLLCPVIDAVAEAHQRGVVHRDIKPENVFLAREGGGKIVPKLLDFGISKVRSQDVRATEAGVMMGTPAYMPPEQLQGARDADARSDVWALGVMLFELLAARLPFPAGDAPSLFVAIATQDAPTLESVCPDIPPRVSKIVERCLRRSPAERYPTAAELARDLRHMIDGQELESTSKRSLPPAAAASVPDLDFPARPEAPTLATSKRPQNPKPTPVRLTPAARAPAAPTPDAPPRPTTTSANLSGVMLAPGAVPASVRRPMPSHAGPAQAAAPPPDMSWVVGLCAVSLVAIAAVAVLMGTMHRPDGWQVLRLVVPDNGAVIVAGQSAAALAIAIAGGKQGKRAFEQWSGESGKGRGASIAKAAVAGALFFAAIELVRGAW